MQTDARARAEGAPASPQNSKRLLLMFLLPEVLWLSVLSEIISLILNNLGWHLPWSSCSSAV